MKMEFKDSSILIFRLIIDLLIFLVPISARLLPLKTRALLFIKVILLSVVFCGKKRIIYGIHLANQGCFKGIKISLSWKKNRKVFKMWKTGIIREKNTVKNRGNNTKEKIRRHTIFVQKESVANWILPKKKSTKIINQICIYTCCVLV